MRANMPSGFIIHKIPVSKSLVAKLVRLGIYSPPILCFKLYGPVGLPASPNAQGLNRSPEFSLHLAVLETKRCGEPASLFATYCHIPEAFSLPRSSGRHWKDTSASSSPPASTDHRDSQFANWLRASIYLPRLSALSPDQWLESVRPIRGVENHSRSKRHPATGDLR